MGIFDKKEIVYVYECVCVRQREREKERELRATCVASVDASKIKNGRAEDIEKFSKLIKLRSKLFLL